MEKMKKLLKAIPKFIVCAFIVVLVAFLLLSMLLGARDLVHGDAFKQPQEPVKAEMIEPTTIETTEPIEEPKETRKYFDVPLDHDVQDVIFEECEKADISPALVVAIIERESDFDPENVGDNGQSIGLMQIMIKHHIERMAELNCENLLDPCQNVKVGIDILAEKIEKYDTIGEALTAYNAGDYGAHKYYFSNGVYQNDFAKKVLKTWEELKSA